MHKHQVNRKRGKGGSKYEIAGGERGQVLHVRLIGDLTQAIAWVTDVLGPSHLGHPRVAQDSKDR